MYQMVTLYSSRWRHIHKQVKMHYPQLSVRMWVVIVCEQHNTLKSQFLLPAVHQTKHNFVEKINTSVAV